MSKLSHLVTVNILHVDTGDRAILHSMYGSSAIPRLFLVQLCSSCSLLLVLDLAASWTWMLTWTATSSRISALARLGFVYLCTIKACMLQACQTPHFSPKIKLRRVDACSTKRIHYIHALATLEECPTLYKVFTLCSGDASTEVRLLKNLNPAVHTHSGGSNQIR
eukprot:scaffold307979_cov23-Tisochrysis_lutea.AAC.1